jgi:SAM-dependent methyltransferase
MSSQSVNAGFERWTVFEKIRAANRMHHREAYATLERVLASGFCRPPRLLDVGCGDARDVAAILKRNKVAGYVGIDNSQDVLDRARDNLSGIDCPWSLTCGDYTAAFTETAANFDIIWLGLFLHHLPDEQKQEFFLRARALASDGGRLITHDPVLLETEDLDGFLQRIGRACREWPELSAEDREMLSRHWSQHGHPDRLSRIREMASRAGWSFMEPLWLDAEDFYAVTAFLHRR